MTDSTVEEWRPVVGYEGLYEVSNLGRVRTVAHTARRSDGRTLRVPARLRKAVPQHHGHLKVQLLVNGQHASFHVHTLVLTAFVGPRPEGLCCRHLNGIPNDNRLENLRWGTPSQNKYDQVRHGTDAHASKTRCLRGHLFDAENTYVYKRPDGGWARGCKECRRERVRARRAIAKEVV